MTFQAPSTDLAFALMHTAGFEKVRAQPAFAEATPETVEAILTEAARLSTDALAPLNWIGDQTPARLDNGVVRTAPGFAEGFAALADGGWLGINAPEAAGGMGLPLSLTMAVHEMFAGGCLALHLNILMTHTQVDALRAHASQELQDLYIPKLLSGEWSGTMNLTEPQAGSDVGALRTRAEPLGDGTYAITGQKIYITWGDSDFAQNICHLVLARLPDGGPGTKGISLFMVPKVLPNPDGSLGPRNDLRVVSLEHKMGQHGAPTAVMDYSGAKGWLVGEPHGGMAAMFTMMNGARLGVGIQAIGVAEAATQAAIAYAADRVQGKVAGRGTIIEHAERAPDAGHDEGRYLCRAIHRADQRRSHRHGPRRRARRTGTTAPPC